MFSKACEYAIRASIIVASESVKGNRMSLKEISEKVDSPEAFTAKILQKLVKNNIILSAKGPGGGFDMDSKSLDQINLMQIVVAIDGDSVFSKCGLGLKECSESRPCPFHQRYKPVREKLKKLLDSTSMEDLLSGFETGLTFLKTNEVD